MTRYLYLVRHAEAESPAGGFNDFYRSLTPHGMIDAARMGRWLKSKVEPLTKLISSPAERTRMTTFVFSEQLGVAEDKIIYNENLYEGGPRHYLNAVNELNDKDTAVMLVGHNPGITYFAEYLTHDEFGNVPTAGVVGIAFENLSWLQVSGRTGKLIFYDSPEKLMGMDLK